MGFTDCCIKKAPFTAHVDVTAVVTITKMKHCHSGMFTNSIKAGNRQEGIEQGLSLGGVL
jgi:hypothetical protein